MNEQVKGARLMTKQREAGGGGGREWDYGRNYESR